ncbi:unnamed protein product [Hyaloperonospora brassicae]|uniref:Uncharacterized protein n=1 Tax=Hyaloperonospora brassicae TaxID=162125 RepID=A0AAV0TEN3_HYABA|nr:unnamed protein product [Hyaloperonospora brassicae]
MSQERDAAETWDLKWMAAVLQSSEAYEAALETAEFPGLLLTALEELLKAPEANAAQLQELFDILLQMIEFPIDSELHPDTVTLLHSSRNWAIQTLLDVEVGQARVMDEALLHSPTTMPKCLQHMQSTLFVSAPCRSADVEMELIESMLVALEDEADSDTISDVLEMCAASLQNDSGFLEFAETALSGKSESLKLGSGFLKRLYDRIPRQLRADEGIVEHDVRRGRRLFDALTLESRVRVWANHLPSWRTQLQTWMLAAHRSPLEPISSVVRDRWWSQDDSSTDGIFVTCRRHSHLYVTFIEWCRCHVHLLSSCRGMELVSMVSQSTRPENSARLFGRQLLSHVPLDGWSLGSWSCDQRQQAFTTIQMNLERLQKSCSTSDVVWQYEWIGILERSHLLHEALELTFQSGTDSNKIHMNNGDQCAAQSSVKFFSWFHSFHTPESADEIASLLLMLSSKLKVPEMCSGAQWLRRSRADFGSLPILRLRLVWFWLLKSIDDHLHARTVMCDDRAVTLATTDVLESIEYVFRRFTPQRAKRPFQVELVTQLLVELEWRVTNTRCETKSKIWGVIEPVRVWLAKVVSLMQLEEQAVHQKDNRMGYGSRRNAANDVEHLATRLEQLLC